jgi:hypothetical protein
MSDEELISQLRRELDEERLARTTDKVTADQLYSDLEQV